MTLISPSPHLSPEDASELAAKYGTIEHFLTSVEAWEDEDGGGGGAAAAAAAASAPQRAALLAALLATPPPALAPPAPADGAEMVRRAAALRALPTGAPAVDALLGAGLREGQVTEVAGPTAAGKTQLCLQAAATRAAHGERVLYVDTTGGFSAARLTRLAAAAHAAAAAEAGPAAAPPLDLDAVLDRVSVVRPHSAAALLSCLDELSAQLGRAPDARCLVVVDSISAALSPLVGSQLHAQGGVLVGAAGWLLRHVADAHGVAVLITNHMVGGGDGGGGDDRDGGGGGGGGGAREGDCGGGGGGWGLRPALGAQWRGQPHVRIELSRAGGGAGGGGGGCGEVIVATLTAATSQAAGARRAFVVSDEGLVPPPRGAPA